MKKVKIIAICIIAALILLGGGVMLVSQKSAQNKAEVITATVTPVLEIFTGKVEVKLPGEDFIEGTEGQKIPVGTIIRTDTKGRAQVKFPNNSVTRIDHASEMTLDKFENGGSQTNVKISLGRIWNRVAKLLGKGDEFASVTETLVASVRGTSYGHGILSDGSNKISVSRSEVEVECNVSQKTINIEVNKKLTTKCTSNLSAVNWGNEENNDEWFKWNLEEDKKLDEKFGLSTYDDLPSPTPSVTPKPTIKPTVKPTVKGTSTTAPSATPTSTPTAAATATSTPTPTPPNFTVDRASCNENESCGEQNAKASVYGSNFSTDTQTYPAKVFAVNQEGQKFYANNVTVETSGLIYANYSSIASGTYYVGVEQYGTSNENKNATFTIFPTIY